jgi:hypothetical protein
MINICYNYLRVKYKIEIVTDLNIVSLFDLKLNICENSATWTVIFHEDINTPLDIQRKLILKGQTMVYDTLNCWVFGLRQSSDILKNTTFPKLDLFPSSGDGVEDTYSVGSVRKS